LKVEASPLRPRHLIRPLLIATVVAAGAGALPSAAAAEVGHVVQPGETLWTIAAANNLTTRTVAAYNGLPENANVILGSTITVPTTAEGLAKLQSAGLITAPAAVTTTQGTDAAAAPKPMGAYTVRAGDSLTALAANAGVPVASMAAMNGLAPDAGLVTGTVLRLPAGSPTPARASEPVPATRVVPKADPEPTAARVDASKVQSIASAAGVPPSLAAAIGWQESGFNNNMVSGANARGVMQVMPGTWDWVESNLAGRQLDASSATDNVNAGVLYLKHLLKETGGDESKAIASYYQGLGSVQSRGMYDDTKQYVNNVQALRSRFGG
jgi:N-acetylmuramoyl-L-alanine amidase